MAENMVVLLLHVLAFLDVEASTVVAVAYFGKFL